MCVSFACACLAFDLLVAEPLHEAFEPLDVGGRRGRRSSARAARARPSRGARRATGRRSRWSGPATSSRVAFVTASRNQRSCATRIDGGVERGQLALEPFEARDVQVVRRLVQEEEVGVAAERRARATRGSAPRRRTCRGCRSRSLSAKPRPRTTDGGAVAPGVAARMLEPRLRLGVAVQRGRVVGAAAPSPPRAVAAPPRARRGRTRPRARTRAASARARAAGAGRAARPARPCRGRSSPGPAGSRPAIRRSSVVLPAPFGPESARRSRALDLERDVVEEDVAAELLASALVTVTNRHRPHRMTVRGYARSERRLRRAPCGLDDRRRRRSRPRRAARPACPEPGISRTASDRHAAAAPPRRRTPASTASPSPPSGQWSSTVTIGPSRLAASRRVASSIGFTE